MEDLLSVLFSLCAIEGMTLIRSVGGSWRLFTGASVLIGTVITAVDGDEKGLLDDSKLNTRYRDTGPR